MRDQLQAGSTLLESDGKPIPPNTPSRPVLSRVLAAIAIFAFVAGCGGQDKAGATNTKLAATLTSTQTGYTVLNLFGDPAVGPGAKSMNNLGHVVTNGNSSVYLFNGIEQKPILSTTEVDRYSASKLTDTGYISGRHAWQTIDQAFRWHPSNGYIEYSRVGTYGATVNNLGHVLVSAWNGYSLWDGTTEFLIPCRVVALNDNDVAVGGLATGCAWSPNEEPTSIPAPVGYKNNIQLYKINNAGAAIGVAEVLSSSNSNVIFHLFKWSKASGIQMLPYGNAYAADINEGGTVTGAFMRDDGLIRSYVFPPGASTPIDLSTTTGTTSYDMILAKAINNNGDVVGSAFRGFDAIPFIWSQAGGFVDLNTKLINAPAGLVIYQPIEISDSGSILAYSNVGTVLLKPGVSSNATPSVGAVATNDPTALGAAITASVNFTDADAGDTHTALWSWGDGTTSTAALTESGGAGNATGTHIYAQSGVYDVVVQVTDSTGKSASVTRTVVVYDPAGGFVTGGGWINSPLGAYKADQSMSGRATFGFVSKYKKGATVPSGETDFAFATANLTFHSEQYDWLVVAGARAQYKGTGVLNGAPGYKFILTAVDGDLIAKGTKDRFRIKIWHSDDNGNDVVDYDNQIDTSAIGSNTEGAVLGGGSIVIHK